MLYCLFYTPTATTQIYTLSLHDALPISKAAMNYLVSQGVQANRITIISYGEERPACTERSESCWAKNRRAQFLVKRSEEHTSELQSLRHLVCRLLLEKKKKKK